jgi:hypothetical protein
VVAGYPVREGVVDALLVAEVVGVLLAGAEVGAGLAGAPGRGLGLPVTQESTKNCRIWPSHAGVTPPPPMSEG